MVEISTFIIYYKLLIKFVNVLKFLKPIFAERISRFYNFFLLKIKGVLKYYVGKVLQVFYIVYKHTKNVLNIVRKLILHTLKSSLV